MISFINKGVSKLQNTFLEQKMQLPAWVKYIVMLTTLGVYSAVFIFLSDTLKVSVNFFVLIPMFVAASLFHFWGGLISGLLALPANLLLLWIQDKLIFAPDSLVTALLFGIGTGTVLGFLSSFYVKLRKEIEEHKLAREELDAALEQKQLLLHEGHHRIKNNLAIITGIIELELFEEKEPRQKNFLHNLIDRIRSISITQNLLYTIENIRRIEMHAFISKLIDQLTLSIAIKEQDINFVLNVDKIILDIEKALPIGLIIYECCTNSIKYAFSDTENPAVRISLTETENRFVLTISDNGPGLPADVIDSGSDSIGLNLIDRLVRQINGSLRLQNDNGAVLEVSFLDTASGN